MFRGISPEKKPCTTEMVLFMCRDDNLRIYLRSIQWSSTSNETIVESCSMIFSEAKSRSSWRRVIDGDDQLAVWDENGCLLHLAAGIGLLFVILARSSRLQRWLSCCTVDEDYSIDLHSCEADICYRKQETSASCILWKRESLGRIISFDFFSYFLDDLIESRIGPSDVRKSELIHHTTKRKILLRDGRAKTSCSP